MNVVTLTLRRPVVLALTGQDQILWTAASDWDLLLLPTVAELREIGRDALPRLFETLIDRALNHTDVSAANLVTEHLVGKPGEGILDVTGGLGDTEKP